MPERIARFFAAARHASVDGQRIPSTAASDLIGIASDPSLRRTFVRRFETDINDDDTADAIRDFCSELAEAGSFEVTVLEGREKLLDDSVHKPGIGTALAGLAAALKVGFGLATVSVVGVGILMVGIAGVGTYIVRLKKARRQRQIEGLERLRELLAVREGKNGGGGDVG